MTCDFSVGAEQVSAAVEQTVSAAGNSGRTWWVDALALNLKQVSSLRGLAHGFNSDAGALLNKMSANCEQIKFEAAADFALQEKISQMEFDIQFFGQLLEAYGDMATGGLSRLNPGQIGSLYKNGSRMRLKDSSMYCEFAIPPSIDLINMDPKRLSLMINNLIFYMADQATADDTIVVTVKNETFDGKRKPCLALTDQAKYVSIHLELFGKSSLAKGRTAQARGHNIPDHELAFDVFTIQGKNKLAVALANTIAIYHGGLIASPKPVSGQPPQSITIYLPAFIPSESVKSISLQEASQTDQAIPEAMLGTQSEPMAEPCLPVPPIFASPVVGSV